MGRQRARLAKLSEVLFVETVRCYINALPPDQIGWLAGARDRILFRDFRTGQMVSSNLL